jgi:hypothetical protein
MLSRAPQKPTTAPAEEKWFTFAQGTGIRMASLTEEWSGLLETTVCGDDARSQAVSREKHN